MMEQNNEISISTSTVLVEKADLSLLLKKIDTLNKKVTSLEDKVNPKEVDIIYDLDEVAKITGFKSATIRAKISRKQIPHSKKNGKVYFSKKRLREWMMSGEVKTNAESFNERVKNLK